MVFDHVDCLPYDKLTPQPTMSGQKSVIPPQGSRSDWQPSSDEDYGDGGAFPEIHLDQYPLGIGRTGDLVNSIESHLANIHLKVILQKTDSILLYLCCLCAGAAHTALRISRCGQNHGLEVCP
jgi:hypothetical protein